MEIGQEPVAGRTQATSAQYIHKESLTSCDKAYSSLLYIDFYSQPVRLMLPKQADRYRTVLGSCLSILTFVFVVIYFGYQMVGMVDYDGYSTELRIEEDVFTPNDPFNSEDIGFAIAVGITDYLGGTEWIEDPTYGEVKIFRKYWNSPAGEFVSFTPLETVPC